MSEEGQGRLEPDLWLRCLEEDYLRSFIPEGGATVKLAVVPKDSYSWVRKALLEKLNQYSFHIFDLTEECLKLHSVEQLWFALAQRVDWETFAKDLRFNILQKIGYPPRLDLQDCTLEQLAEFYQIEAVRSN